MAGTSRHPHLVGFTHSAFDPKSTILDFDDGHSFPVNTEVLHLFMWLFASEQPQGAAYVHRVVRVVAADTATEVEVTAPIMLLPLLERIAEQTQETAQANGVAPLVRPPYITIEDPS